LGRHPLVDFTQSSGSSRKRALFSEGFFIKEAYKYGEHSTHSLEMGCHQLAALRKSIGSFWEKEPYFDGGKRPILGGLFCKRGLLWRFRMLPVFVQILECSQFIFVLL